MRVAQEEIRLSKQRSVPPAQQIILKGTLSLSALCKFSFTIAVHSFSIETECNLDAKRLYDDILRRNNYNKLIRPVGNNTDKLTVKLGLRLSQLIDVVSALISILFNVSYSDSFFPI